VNDGPAGVAGAGWVRAVEFRILGPLEVSSAEGQLIAAMWPDRVPFSAAKNPQTYI
jgi:hypothetical protein